MCEHQARGTCRMCEQERLEEDHGVPDDYIEETESNSHASRVASQIRMAEDDDE